MRRPFLGRLSVRLLAFNLLLVFLPLASLLYLDTYEKQLLEMQEASMIQQGRVFASAMAGVDLAAESTAILARLGARVDSRIRVVDTGGRLVADSAAEPAAAKPRSAPGAEAQAASRKANERMLYRTFVSPINAVRRWLLPPGESYDSGEFYSGAATLLGPEVQAALAGRYGSITRLSTGGQVSVNLYSAIPVFGSASNEVRGAVLVSRSTYGILRRLYEVRLELIKVFVFSLAAALLLSVALSMTITVPIVRLKRQAEGVLDRSGRFRGRFTGLRRKDEIGDLSRSLSDLSARLERRIGFIDGFTADLLHELKNPLAAIRGAVELALSEPGDDDVGGGDDAGGDDDGDPAGDPASGLASGNARVRGLLLRVRDEELRMERLLSRLRELGRIDNRMDDEEASLVDLAELAPLILSRYPHKDYPTVRVVFDARVDGPALVRANPDRLTQLLSNPVDNAVSFSPVGSTVTVRLSAGSLSGLSGYLVEVDDDGPGADPASLPRAFDRFYSDRPAAAADEHTGLGLAIAHAIATGYGGACSLENRPEGGCRFSLVLPRA